MAAMARQDVVSMFAVSLFIGAFASVPTSVQSIGVCYGMNGTELPNASEVVQMYRSMRITGMRLYSPDANALSALRNSRIGLILDVGEQLANLAASRENAASWVKNNVQPYYPAVNITYIAAGNEVQGDATQSIVPAMQNLNAALQSNASLRNIKVSTSIRFDALANDSFPPSNGVFKNAYMTDVVRLLASNGAPLLVNVYPYFAYIATTPPSIDLKYATFQPQGPTVHDQNNGLNYTCLFDAMVDAVYAALEKADPQGVNVRVVVSESGWPSAGGGSAASVDNAQKYNQGLINHVGNGTPKRRGALLETYIFAMFNEDGKPGEETEKHFGLFNPDKKPAYAIKF